MSTTAHAVLSPSSSHRWLNCTPSAVLERHLGKDTQPNEYAQEGTVAHELAHYFLRFITQSKVEEPVSPLINTDMELHIIHYKDYIEEIIADFPLYAYEHCKFYSEYRVDLSKYIPDCFGTVDFFFFHDGSLHVVDLKYGMGEFVEAEENSQLMLYALGLMEELKEFYTIYDVTLHIYQPRKNHASIWETTPKYLLDWAENTLKPKVDLAITGEGEHSVGAWCKYCKVGNRCRARASQSIQLLPCEEAPLLADEEIEVFLPFLPELKKWAETVLAYANEKAVQEGKQWQGFKVVRGASHRRFTQPEEVQRRLEHKGHTSDVVESKLISLASIERLLGKTEFAELLGDLVYKPQGKLALVPEADRRKAVEVSNTKNDFSKFMEE